MHTVFEHEAVDISDVTSCGVDPKGFQRYLDKNHLDDVLSVNPCGIKAKSFVGVIKYHNLQITILPKLLSEDTDNNDVIIKNLMYMLSYTKRLNIKANEAKLTNSNNHFLDALIQIYANSLFDNLKKYTPKNYISKSDNLNYMKGKLNFPNHIKYNAANLARFYCDYDEFVEDIPLNQLFLYVATVLRNLTKNSDTKKVLSNIINFYSDITFVQFDAYKASKIKLTKNQLPFQKPFKLAKMFLEHSCVDLSKNKVENIALIWDMNTLFEEFVFETMRRHTPRLDGLQAQKGRRLLEDAINGKKRLNTFVDIFDAIHGVVIDTKYKKFTSLIDVSNSDIFQVSTYCLIHSAKKAALIYPQWDNRKLCIAHRLNIENPNGDPEKIYQILFKNINLRRDLRAVDQQQGITVHQQIARELCEMCTHFGDLF